MKDDDFSSIGKLGAFVTLPFVLAVPPILGWWIGGRLDRWLDTGPYLMYVLMGLGVVAAVREFIRIIKRFGDGV